MDDDIKKGIKKIARNTETMVAGSILRWRYKKEGKKIPDDKKMEQKSKEVAEQAHQIISRRGKNIWTELKNAYHKGRNREGQGD